MANEIRATTRYVPAQAISNSQIILRARVEAFRSIISARPDQAVRLSSSTRKAISGTSYAGANRFPSDDRGIIVTSQWLIAARAEQAMGRLPARYRTLLRLSCDLDPRNSEAADRMAQPIGSTGPMRIRAIRMLNRRREESPWAW